MMVENSCLVLIDVQEKLAAVMHDRERVIKNISILLQVARTLNIPMLWCQQNPDALGNTLPELTQYLQGVEPIDKFCFSCCDSEKFISAYKKINPTYVFVCGIEAHVCVFQTVRDILNYDIEADVHVVADAIASRSNENKQIAIQRMQDESATITSTEILLFELLKTAKHEKFKELAKLIK